MTLISGLRDDRARHLDRTLSRLAPIARTTRFRRKIEQSRRIVEDWLSQCSAPAVACGGGKDSTALLLVCLSVRPGLPIYRADPPNPLPDRAEHVDALAMAAGGEWRVVPYPWDVEAVLDGELRYPEGLKVRRLCEEFATAGVDGVALGLRISESRGRLWNWRVRGPIYRARGLLHCTPLATWTAEEVVAYTLHEDRLPLNPVYRRLLGAPPLDQLRDGTWYPREYADASGYEDWLGTHYPDVVGLYRRALRAGRGLW